MRATVYYAPGDVRVENVPDPSIQQPTDAVMFMSNVTLRGGVAPARAYIPELLEQ